MKNSILCVVCVRVVCVSECVREMRRIYKVRISCCGSFESRACFVPFFFCILFFFGNPIDLMV